MNEMYMRRALELAKKGRGYVSPNPLVGAVIVRDGAIIGEGYHMKYGENHAEINAINSVKDKELLRGSELYVNLEPCAHYGKTPPCAVEIVKHGFSKVVIGALDINEKVSGKGVRILKDAGIEVIVGVLEEECYKLNEVFYKFIKYKRPYVVSKWAQSIDGKISTEDGDSKWISCEESRKYVHKLRNNYSSIMCGVETIIKDNPLLTCRIDGGSNPIRFILDTHCRIPYDAAVVSGDYIKDTYIVVGEDEDNDRIYRLKQKGVNILRCPIKDKRIDIEKLCEIIGKMNIDSILIEGGSSINASAIKANIVDKIYVFIAPKIIGNEGKGSVGNLDIDLIKNCVNIHDYKSRAIGSDIVIEGYIN